MLEFYQVHHETLRNYSFDVLSVSLTVLTCKVLLSSNHISRPLSSTWTNHTAQTFGTRLTKHLTLSEPSHFDATTTPNTAISLHAANHRGKVQPELGSLIDLIREQLPLWALSIFSFHSFTYAAHDFNSFLFRDYWFEPLTIRMVCSFVSGTACYHVFPHRNITRFVGRVSYNYGFGFCPTGTGSVIWNLEVPVAFVSLALMLCGSLLMLRSPSLFTESSSSDNPFFALSALCIISPPSSLSHPWRSQRCSHSLPRNMSLPIWSPTRTGVGDPTYKYFLINYDCLKIFW